MASSAWLTIAVAVVVVLVEVNATPECLQFEWVGQEDSPFKGIRIAGTAAYSQQVAVFDNITNAADCFYECCLRALESDSCNAASFHKDAEGTAQCFLLSCDPFTDCEWTLSYDEEQQSEFIKIVKETTEDIKQLAEKIEGELKWNIIHEDTTTTSAATSTTTSATTAPPSSTATTEAETESNEVTAPPNQAQIDWPAATDTADKGMGATANNENSATGLGGDDEGSPKTLVTKKESDGVSKTAIIVCSFGGVALLVAGLVIAIKRNQVEKERSVYRPLMDDIHTQSFKESDPLN